MLILSDDAAVIKTGFYYSRAIGNASRKYVIESNFIWEFDCKIYIYALDLPKRWKQMELWSMYGAPTPIVEYIHTGVIQTGCRIHKIRFMLQDFKPDFHIL